MPAVFWGWLSAVIQAYSEFSSKVKILSILMILMFPFSPVFLESPPAAMSRNGYFFEESGKYYLTSLCLVSPCWRESCTIGLAENLKQVIQNPFSLSSMQRRSCIVVA